MEIIKNPQNKNKKEALYRNDFIDDVIFNYDKRMLILLFFLIYKLQDDVAKITVSEVKKILDNNVRSEKYIKKLIEKMYDTAVYYKVEEPLFNNEKLIANKNDFIKDHLFDILVFSKDGKFLKFSIKERYRKYFNDLKSNFSVISIELLKVLNSSQILIYLYLNRWKNYEENVESDWKYFKLSMGFSKGYKNNDVLRKLDIALQKIRNETGLNIEYEIIRSQNKREILKIIFKINRHLKELKQMLNSENEITRKFAKLRLKQLEKNKWQEEK